MQCESKNSNWRSLGSPEIVVLWWVVWLAGPFAGALINRIDPNVLDPRVILLLSGTVTFTALMFSAIFLATILERVTKHQDIAQIGDGRIVSERKPVYPG